MTNHEVKNTKQSFFIYAAILDEPVSVYDGKIIINQTESDGLTTYLVVSDSASGVTSYFRNVHKKDVLTLNKVGQVYAFVNTTPDAIETNSTIH